MRHLGIASCSFVIACSGGGAKGPPARPDELRKMLELLAGEPDAGPELANGIAEVCGGACACLARGATTDALIDCATACPAEIRAAAKKVNGDTVVALATHCGPRTLGLPADHGDLASVEWLRLHVAGQYVADQIERAGAKRAALEAALAKLTIRLPPPSSQTGSHAYRLPEARNAGPLEPRPLTYVIVTAQGALRAGALPKAVLDAHGVRYPDNAMAGDDGLAVDSPGMLYDTLRTLSGTKDRRDDAPLPEEDPPPPSVDPQPAESTDAPSRDSGKMGKRPAQAGGVLGSSTLKPGFRDVPSFRDIPSTGVLSAGFENAARGAQPRLVVHGRIHRIDPRQPLLLADRAASSQRVLEVLAIAGGTIGVGSGTLAGAHAVIFESGASLPRAGSSGKLVVTWGKDAVVVQPHPGEAVVATIPISTGAVDTAALTQAYAAARTSPDLAGVTDAVISLDHEASLGALVSVLDALSAGGATSFQVLGTPSPDASGPDGVGQLSSTGELDQGVIRAVLVDNMPTLTRCYKQQLRTNPTLAGKVPTEFFITPRGTVARAKASGLDPDLDRCVAKAIEKLAFPRPKGVAGVQVHYVLSFQPE